MPPMIENNFWHIGWDSDHAFKIAGHGREMRTNGSLEHLVFVHEAAMTGNGGL